MKPLSKLIATLLATLLVLPAVGLCKLAMLLLPADKAFAGWSQCFSLAPGLSGVYLRRAFYRMVLDHCGADACISFGVIISHPSAQIGERTYVGPFCSLGDVTLGDDVLLGSHVSIMNGSAQHGSERLDVPMREQPGQWPRVTIGEDTWLGDRALIMADVGAHCVIGAGSIVTKPIPDYAVAVGAPAKVVKFRNETPAEEIA
jgi:acetyltransferase-like isoleucine patch superfamily enzyme